MRLDFGSLNNAEVAAIEGFDPGTPETADFFGCAIGLKEAKIVRGIVNLDRGRIEFSE